MRVRMETRSITDWKTFHDHLARVFGFPGFYGKNMDAWIDCMSSLDDPGSGMSSITLEENEPLLLEVEDTEAFRERCPEQFEALVECSAAVNRRCCESKRNPFLSLVFI